jgi:hypothetical protein
LCSNNNLKADNSKGEKQMSRKIFHAKIDIICRIIAAASWHGFSPGASWKSCPTPNPPPIAVEEFFLEGMLIRSPS